MYRRGWGTIGLVSLRLLGGSTALMFSILFGREQHCCADRATCWDCAMTFLNNYCIIIVQFCIQQQQYAALLRQ